MQACTEAALHQLGHSDIGESMNKMSVSKIHHQSQLLVSFPEPDCSQEIREPDLWKATMQELLFLLTSYSLRSWGGTLALNPVRSAWLHREGIPINCIAAISHTGNSLAKKSLCNSRPSVVAFLLAEVLCRRSCSEQGLSVGCFSWLLLAT